MTIELAYSDNPTWLRVERTAIAVHLFPIAVVGMSRFFVSSEPTAACGYVLRHEHEGGTFSVRAADTSDGWDICGGCARTRRGREFPPPVEPGYGHELGPATSEDRRRRLLRGASPYWFRATIKLAFQASSLDDAEARLMQVMAFTWIQHELEALGSWSIEPGDKP